MENPRRFHGGEIKLPLTEWKEVVIRGVADGTPVDVYLMLYDKLNIVVLSIENGKIVRREEPTREYGDPRYDDPFYDPLEMMFRGWLNTGNVIDVGDGGTFLDYEVRYGVVCDVGVLWLKDGKEKDVIDALTESMKPSPSSNEAEEEAPDSREGSHSFADLIPDRPKRDIAVGWAYQLAELMLQIPDGMKRAIVRGMDSDGKPFYFYTVPVFDELAYRNWGYMYSGETNTQDASARMNSGEGKNIIYALYSDVVGFIRFPAEIVNFSPERRLTPGNFSRIVEMLVPEIINNPEKWITDI